MKLFRFVPVILLMGCSSVDPAEDVLNDYAAVAMEQSLLPNHLTGSALISARETADLIESLGLRPSGTSNFSQTQIAGVNRYRSCLDVSETKFFDASGVPVFLDRIERQLVLVTLSEGKISELELDGTPC